MTPLRNAGLALLNLLYPLRCVSCRADLLYNKEGPLCPACEAGIRPFDDSACEQCGAPQPIAMERCLRCLEEPRAFSAVRSYALYRGALKEMIRHFKYLEKDRLSEDLGGFLYQCWERDERFWSAEAIVPVPPHSARLRERGYDHTLFLAESLLEKIREHPHYPLNGSLVLLDGLLKRTKTTPSQTGLSRTERKANVQDAFEWLGEGEAEGRKILLIDDVCTTAATLDACARTLRRAGAREVLCLTVARD